MHSAAVDIEGVPSIISTDGQRSAVVLDPIVATRKGGGLMKEISVLEPLEHSVLGLSPEGGDVCRDDVVGPHPLEHSGVDRLADLMEGTSGLEPLEHSVPKVPLDEGGQSICSKSVSDLLDRAGSVGKSLSAPSPTMYSEGAGDGRCRVRDPGGVDGTLPEVRKGANRVSLEEGEAIVVGAIGSAAPWFLTGWSSDMEVEFMIDTGCQVTILATSVFERMCAADPQVRARLRPCGHRLVSADSSPLTVK